MITIKQAISFLIVCSFWTLSNAGIIHINATEENSEFEAKSLNLTVVDSISFSGKGDARKFVVLGKSGFSTKIANIEEIRYSLKKESAETMTITVTSGVYKGETTFALADITSIDFETIDDMLDTDGDGLSDIKEIYFYDTNPRSADTDGDGWSDGEEVADGMFNINNPTSFNPKVSDVPSLEVLAIKSPKIVLKVETTSGTSKNVTISEGMENSSSMTLSSETSRSSALENAWEISTTQGWEIGANSKWVGSVTVGYNGSYTSTNGVSWGNEEQTAVAESYEKALSEEYSEGSSIVGAELCHQVKLTNTSDIAYTIESLVLSASVYEVSDKSSIRVIADLVRDGASTDWSATLRPNESTEALFCNSDLPVDRVKDVIYNADAILLGPSTQKITFTTEGGASTDFTEAYTKVNAKTAALVLDYGPGAVGKEVERYFVATNYRYNEDHSGSKDMYQTTSLAQVLSTLQIPFTQDSVEAREGKKNYGLAAINGFSNSKKEDAWWYVVVDAAADIKLKNNRVTIYSVANGSFNLNDVLIGSGDAVQLFYSKDADGDGLPVRTEVMLGTSDSVVDTDGDGLTDFEEVQGWSRPENPDVIYYTNPAKADTDGDGINDKEDENPNARSMFKTAEISSLKVLGMIQGAPVYYNCDSSKMCGEKITARAIPEARVTFEFTVTDPVRSVQVILRNGNLPTEKRIKESVFVKSSGDKSYAYSISNTLSLSSADTLLIKIISEDELSVKTYAVALPSTIGTPTDFKLGRNNDRTSILGSFLPSKDGRVMGYVVIKGEGSYNRTSISGTKGSFSKNTAIGTYSFSSSTVAPAAGQGLNNGLFVAFTQSGSSFEDKVGGGSPYYSYRVHAYVLENGYYYYSQGSTTVTRSVGRIGMNYKWTHVGGNDANCYASQNCDYTYWATLYEEKNNSGYLIKKFDGAYIKSVGSGGGYSWYTIDQSEFSYNLDSKGLFLDLGLKADKGSNQYYGDASRTWSYANMSNVIKEILTADGSNAPKNNQPTEITEVSSGGSRKGAYRFNFNYFFVDDDAFYN